MAVCTGDISDTCHGRLTRPGRAPVPVSLNVLHELMSDAERREFLAAAENIARFSSDNVERLEGIVTTQLPYMIVTELPSNGSLLDFIRVRFIVIIIFVVVVFVVVDVVIIIISCSLSSFHYY